MGGMILRIDGREREPSPFPHALKVDAIFGQIGTGALSLTKISTRAVLQPASWGFGG
jgi:hypothetical protein